MTNYTLGPLTNSLALYFPFQSTWFTVKDLVVLQQNLLVFTDCNKNCSTYYEEYDLDGAQSNYQNDYSKRIRPTVSKNILILKYFPFFLRDFLGKTFCHPCHFEEFHKPIPFQQFLSGLPNLNFFLSYALSRVWTPFLYENMNHLRLFASPIPRTGWCTPGERPFVPGLEN